MDIRNMQAGEEMLLWQLFHDTIHTVNLSDYTAAQLQAWSPAEPDRQAWTRRMQQNAPFLAHIDDQLVGFADLQADGLVDFLYVHHDYQRQGVGKALLAEVHARARAAQLPVLYAFVSLTAEPLFAAHGFAVVSRQQVPTRGQLLNNCRMEKHLRGTR